MSYIFSAKKFPEEEYIYFLVNIFFIKAMYFRIAHWFSLSGVAQKSLRAKDGILKNINTNIDNIPPTDISGTKPERYDLLIRI